MTVRAARHLAVVPREAGGAGTPADEALVAGMAAGDASATVTFVRRYQRRVFGLAVSILSDRAAAEDVAQEALVRAWRHAPVFDPRRGSVDTWVLTITRNLSVDALRRRRSVPTDPEALVALAKTTIDSSTEDLGIAGLVRRPLLEALDALSIEQRRAVVLAALFGRTAREISESEGIPIGTAKTRIRAGLGRLRQLLEHESRNADDAE